MGEREVEDTTPVPATMSQPALAQRQGGLCVLLSRGGVGLSQCLESRAHLSHEGLRLLPRREVAPFLEPVVVNELWIRPLRPTPRRRTDLVGERAHGDGN